MADDILTHSSEQQDLLSRQRLPMDEEPEVLSLRPEKLSDYVGQTEIVETLKIAIEAAKIRQEPIDHILFHGPPGLGKTTAHKVLRLARLHDREVIEPQTPA